MTRTMPWPPIVVALAAATVAVVGCTARKDSPPKMEVKSAPQAVPKPDGTKLLADWPRDSLAGVLLVSGQQVGYLEPCGCTQGQQGGLGRRYDLIERLRSQGVPVTPIDLGSLAEPPGSRGGADEAKIKFSVALRALTAMKYAAIALSADDLRQGAFEAMGQYLNLDPGAGPTVVAANVKPGTGFEAAIRPSVRAEVGPVKVGITAVLDPEALKEVNDPDLPSLLTVRPPEEALPTVLADLEKDTHIQVLMVQGPHARALELARAYPGVEIVVATLDHADPDAEPEVVNDGKTSVVSVGQKGKYVGVVGLFQDPKRKFRYQRVALNQFYKNAEPMRKLIDEDFVGELKTMQVVENYPKHGNPHAAPGATYVGAEACKACHPNTFARWASTKHAEAYKPLTKPERNREADAECISCHTTGFEYTSGFRSVDLTPYLKGNQCENCHGPGSKHAAEPDHAEYRQALARAVANAEQTRLCFRCHDEDNSPKFDFNTYYGKIVHKKMDTYDDPKVHRGLPDKVARRAD